MRRAKEPWFRTGRGWFTQHRGKKVFLGHDKQTAQLLFHQLMATGSVSPPVSANAPIITILDAYLEWLDHRVREGSKSPANVRVVQKLPARLQRFPDRSISRSGSGD